LIQYPLTLLIRNTRKQIKLTYQLTRHTRLNACALSVTSLNVQSGDAQNSRWSHTKVPRTVPHRSGARTAT